jgi:hypothetical protein
MSPPTIKKETKISRNPYNNNPKRDRRLLTETKTLHLELRKMPPKSDITTNNLEPTKMLLITNSMTEEVELAEYLNQERTLEEPEELETSKTNLIKTKL